MKLELEYGSASIVLLGSFNPRIFNPDWLQLRKLISEEEAIDSTVSLVHADITNFRVGTRNIQIEPNRFSIDTTEAPFVALADFVVSLFDEILPHTPIYRLGINRTAHFRVRDEKARNDIGRKFAPLAPWGAWGEAIDASPVEARGGFASLTMQQTRNEANLSGHTQATIQPSTMSSLGKAGIYVAVNDDYFIDDKPETDHSRELLDILTSRFDASLQKSDQIIEQIMQLDAGA